VIDVAVPGAVRYLRPRRSLLEAMLSAALVVGLWPAGAAWATSPTPVRSSPQAAQRIVALGEEYVLADLLALDLVPIASTATVPEAGFHALDAYDTTAIEPLSIDINLEYLVSLEPDLIVVLELWLDYVPVGSLEGIAPTLVVPNGLSTTEQIRFLAEQFDAHERADGLIEGLEEAKAEAAAALDGLQVSVAAIYPGPAPAAFVDGPWIIPQALLDSGATLVPAAGEYEADSSGRVWLSNEQLALLAAPQLVLMQSDIVEGESAAMEQVMANPLWPLLPAVNADEVHVIDRLGYPGIEGQANVFRELVELLVPG
jgi:iron complex transport system substrate-binding protein